MDLKGRDRFTVLWEKYFGETELPLAGYYSSSDGGVKIVSKPSGHSCLIAQLTAARKGQINERFACFLSNGEDGGFCERYKQSPDLVDRMLEQIPRLPVTGENLIFKRWDQLEEQDEPQFVIFFVAPDVLAGLFTLARFDNNDAEAVIAPFGAGCTSIVYYLTGNIWRRGNGRLSDCSIRLPGNVSKPMCFLFRCLSTGFGN